MNPVVHFEMPTRTTSAPPSSTLPGIGNYVAIHDTEGNRVGMLQPTPM